MELAIKQLSKKYDRTKYGLKDFSLTLMPGIWGLLGPNGAGKSTLMRILATITKPTSGIVTWNGNDIQKKPNEIRRVLGYLPQDFGIYPNLNAVEFLEYMAAIKGVSGKQTRARINDLLEMVNLYDVRKRPLGGYSGGMKQRIGIAQAMLNNPEILIVDEPTVGLDPEERVRFRNLLTDLSGEHIVMLSTHIVSDVEAIASQIAMINQGQLIKSDLPENFLRAVNGKVWEWVTESSDLIAARKTHLLSGVLRQADGIRLRAIATTQPHPLAEAVLPNLEDAYLYHINANRNGTGA